MDNRMNALRIVVVSLVILVVASLAPAHGQSLVDSDQSTDCAYEFGSGAFVWCVSEGGNLVRLTSPGDAEHIRVGNVAEGYVVCAADVGPYFDVNVASSGWEAPVLVEPPGDTGVSIERMTSDGRFTLLQAFTQNRADRSITIRMTVTNNGEEIGNVRLLRSADFDMDNTRNGDVFDKSDNAAWARQTNSVTLAALNRGVDHHVRLSANLAPRNCSPNAHYGPVPSSGTDLAASIRYDLGHLAPGESRSVRVRYKVY